MPEPLWMSYRARSLALAVGAIVVAAGGSAVMLARRHSVAEPATALRATLDIEPFTSARGTGSWPSLDFADSLADRLSLTPGLSARVEGRGTDFTLRGEVTTDDQRLVVATRLFRRGEATPVWTSTFWRPQDGAFTLVDDLAAAVAEALYGYLARHALDDDGRSR